MPGYVQHFTHAGNDKMKCRYNQEDIKFTNSHLHSSNLRNHLTFKHPEKISVPEKAKVPKIDDYFTGHKSSLPSLPALDRQTLAVCCSAHPLPFNLVEDKVFQWAYNCPVKDRRLISIRVTELARDWREKICGSFPGKFFTILLDGWTNPVTRQSHMCYMLCDRNKLVYWKSVVVEDKRAQNLFEILELTIAELKDAGEMIWRSSGPSVSKCLPVPSSEMSATISKTFYLTTKLPVFLPPLLTFLQFRHGRCMFCRQQI